MRAGGRAAETTAIALVPEVLLERIFGDRRVPLSDDVFGPVAYEFPDVGSDVPAAEVVEFPVCFDGGDFAVVVVVAVVCGAHELFVDC